MISVFTIINTTAPSKIEKLLKSYDFESDAALM